MRTITFPSLLLAVCSLLISSTVLAQATCAAAINLNPASSCTTLSGNLQNAAVGLPAGSCGGATATTTYSVWYRFTATNSQHTITVSNPGSGLATASTYLEVLTGTCGTLTAIACQNISSRMTLTGLTSGTTYYIRLYRTTAPTGNPANKWAFYICVQTNPANDDCSGAINLNPSSSCSNVTTTMDLATPSSGIPAGCASATAHYDVWYKFTATAALHSVTISSLGSNITNPEIQLYSGNCATLSSIACGTTSLTGTNLNIGSIYYIRVSNVGSDPSAAGSGNAFSICIITVIPAKVDYSRSYVNISKSSVGGTVNPGDTLEMRATFVVSSKSVDSLSFTDTLYSMKGLKLIPSSLSLRTNEGKVYKSFTNAFDSDEGHILLSGADTIIRINFGTGATSFARGLLTNTSKPSVYGSTCIVMATYRVVVYAPYNSRINFRTGRLTYRDVSSTVMNSVSFIPNELMVYQSPGLCPNAVSPTNALGAEFNGTFGAPVSTPLTRNRGTSAFTTYTYAPFTSTGGPNDYFYAIANNTSRTFTTVTTWKKPDTATFRLFSLWDISGDHTNASDPIMGNPPCDTTKPKGPNNPCGYMLVINSAYRTDTAFTYNVTNLCPNTYYEISAWFKNMCYKCGCDSNGTGSGGATYIPTGTGDSSGVKPNIAFDVNGTDYFTTGNINYSGFTQLGSDSTNKWVKRGFVYLTGPTETAFRLTLRNNAPGGGGNDWALDDISVATCLPNMTYSPSLNPTICSGNAGSISDTVRSYFSNYNYFKWQRSTDGLTWYDLPGTEGSVSPIWNGAAWEYITTYIVPPSRTDSAVNNGDKYRVVTSTTLDNLTYMDCQVTDGISQISLNVISCSPYLNDHLLEFTASLDNGYARLKWITSKENSPLVYTVEKSNNGISFYFIGRINGNYPFGSETNIYSLLDSTNLNQRSYYRIVIMNQNGDKQYSRVILLKNTLNGLQITRIISPFGGELLFDITAEESVKAEVLLLSTTGQLIRRQDRIVRHGTNPFRIDGMQSVSPGVYILQIRYQDKTIIYRVMKK